MTEHNAWARTPSTPPDPADDEEVETVEAERLPTLNELEGKPWHEQVEALNGAPISSMTVGEMHLMLMTGRWYMDRCHEVGREAPADLLRNLTSCANEVVSYNAWLASQGDRDARPPGERGTRH